jgi:hypothetical protein
MLETGRLGEMMAEESWRLGGFMVRKHGLI